jgi:hypothetical protein
MQADGQPASTTLSLFPLTQEGFICWALASSGATRAAPIAPASPPAPPLPLFPLPSLDAPRYSFALRSRSPTGSSSPHLTSSPTRVRAAPVQRERRQVVARRQRGRKRETVVKKEKRKQDITDQTHSLDRRLTSGRLSHVAAGAGGGVAEINICGFDAQGAHPQRSRPPPFDSGGCKIDTHTQTHARTQARDNRQHNIGQARVQRPRRRRGLLRSFLMV